MRTVKEAADYVRRLEARVTQLENENLEAVRRARIAEEGEKAMSVELAVAQGKTRKALAALEKAVWFIENVPGDADDRTQHFFTAREAWREAFGTIVIPQGDRERLVRILAVRWRTRHTEGKEPSLDIAIASALREYAAEDLVQLVPRAVLVEILSDCLIAINRIPNKPLGGSNYQNTYQLASAVEWVLSLCNAGMHDSPERKHG